jgi:two-component system response regulator AtoC
VFPRFWLAHNARWHLGVRAVDSNPVTKERILIVDDEPTLVFFLRRDLSERGLDCEVEGVGSGEDALARLAFAQYSVLITDLRMPGINGLTLVAAARSLQPTIGVVLMTAFGSHEVEAEAEQLMVDGYLTKPFQMERLHSLVEKILHTRHRKAIENITGTKRAVA